MKNWKTAGNMAVFFFSFRPFSFYISLHFTDLLYIVLRLFLREADSIFYIHRLELSKEGERYADISKSKKPETDRKSVV